MNFRSLERTWIAAEIGVNHEGSEAAAAALIDAAAKTGVDSVKFQTYTPENYVTAEQAERRERVTRFCLSRAAFERLAGRARERGVLFFSTPLHMDDVDFLDRIQPIFKISSGDITWPALLRHIASKRKPVILSTGGTELAEIDAAVAAMTEVWPQMQERGALMLMHCIAAYPAPAEEVNLRAIRFLSDRYGVPVGYSDHTLGTKACELAVAAGAVALEKHFTDSRENRTFHDHLLSSDPAEMAELVATVRRTEAMLGRGGRTRAASEQKFLFHLRRSVGAARYIPAGVPIAADMLTWLRPAWGVAPDAAQALVGRKLKRSVAAGRLVRAEDLE